AMPTRRFRSRFSQTHGAVHLARTLRASMGRRVLLATPLSLYYNCHWHRGGTRGPRDSTSLSHTNGNSPATLIKEKMETAYATSYRDDFKTKHGPVQRSPLSLDGQTSYQPANRELDLLI
ncbi:hypothetical protein J6590_098318, partial [Homalodisca vitripennis]